MHNYSHRHPWYYKNKDNLMLHSMIVIELGKDKPDDTLPTPLERRKWEEKFDAMYLKPILQVSKMI